ncbi:MAG: alkaline phosphatase, partial [Duncaniella sp.]|nr:alkaline phosphatase [Duncaniella sp.]
MQTRFFSFLTMLTAAGAIMAGTPKYIFYYIGDGMGMGQVMATEAYNRTVLGNNDHLLMMQFPVASTSTTFSASSPVTDSAAAGTALSTGHKTNNGMIGMTPDSDEVVSVSKTL